MRNRARMQPWVPLDVRRRTLAYCVTHDVTESALTAAALVQYMDSSGVDEKLVLRRLDGLTQAVAHLQHDLDVLGVAFGGYAWRSFIAVEAPTPKGHEQATSTYWDFLRQAHDQVSQGVRFPGQVLLAGSGQPAPPDARPDGDGGKGGDGK